MVRAFAAAGVPVPDLTSPRERAIAEGIAVALDQHTKAWRAHANVLSGRRLGRVRSGLRVMLAHLPALRAEVEGALADARRKGANSSLGGPLPAALADLERAARALDKLAMARIDPRAHWHGLAHGLALSIRLLARARGEHYGFGEEGRGVRVIAGLLAAAGITVDPAAIAKALKPRGQ